MASIPNEIKNPPLRKIWKEAKKKAEKLANEYIKKQKS